MLAGTLKMTTGEKLGESSNLCHPGLDCKCHTLVVSKRTRMRASFSPVTFPPNLGKVSVVLSSSVFKQMPHEALLNGCEVVSHPTPICHIC